MPASWLSPSDNRTRRYARQSDEKLIAGCLSGDATAWDTLIARYAPLIFALPVRMGLSQADAEDIFQEVCLLLFNHLHSLRDVQRVAGWLISTTKREVWRLARRRGVTLVSEMADEGQEWENAQPVGKQEATPPDRLVLALEEQHLVRQALERLPDRCRDLLTLLYVNDPPASYAEVAQYLHIAVGTIGSARARCLERLHKLLSEAGF